MCCFVPRLQIRGGERWVEPQRGHTPGNHRLLLLVCLCVVIELVPGGHCQADPTESSGRDEAGSQSLGKQVNFELENV